MAGKPWNRKKRITAADAAKLPEHEQPDWYRPPRGSGGGRPASPYEKGNTESLTVGYMSPRVYGIISRTLATDLLESRPDLARFPEAVAAWADAEARAALLRHNLDEEGMFDDDGELRRTRLVTLNTFERSAARGRTALGLDPTSEARLALIRAKAVSVGLTNHQADRDQLERLAEAGRNALEAGDKSVDNALREVEAAAPPKKTKRNGDPQNGTQTG